MLLPASLPPRASTAHQICICSIVSALPARYSLKKARTNQARVQFETPQTPALSSTTLDPEMRTLMKPAFNVDGTFKGQMDSSRLTESADIFQEDLGAHDLPTTRSDPDSDFLNFCVGSRSGPPYQSRTNNSQLVGQGSKGAKPLLGEVHTDDHRREAFERGLQPSPAHKTGQYIAVRTMQDLRN